MASVHGFDIACNGLRKRPTSKVVVVGTPTPPSLPEAGCSVNGFFHVEGFPDRFQATGRGSTPKEAAAQLKGTMDETRTALALPVPQSRETRLGKLLVCGLIKANVKKDTGLVTRLGHAAALVLNDSVQPGNRPGLTTVRSASQPDTWYEVEGVNCTCPDSSRRVHDGTYLCKHLLAAMFVTRLNEEV